MVFNSPCLTDKKELIHHKAEVVPKSIAGSSFPAASSTLLPLDVRYVQKFHVFKSRLKQIGCCCKVHISILK
ncbi:hypothetical protein Tco_0808248, partial [Tanacetum coccineum]